jgi:hypothetical protein
MYFTGRTHSRCRFPTGGPPNNVLLDTDGVGRQPGGGLACFPSSCQIDPRWYDYIGSYYDLCVNMNCYGNRRDCPDQNYRGGMFTQNYGCYCGRGNAAGPGPGRYSSQGPVPWDALDQCCADHDDNEELGSEEAGVNSERNQAFCLCLVRVNCAQTNIQQRNRCRAYRIQAITAYCNTIRFAL